MGYNGCVSPFPQLMSDEQLKGFADVFQGDATLKEKLKGLGDPNAVVAIAKEMGFVITAKELKSLLGELSEKELESVVGGQFMSKGSSRIG